MTPLDLNFFERNPKSSNPDDDGAENGKGGDTFQAKTPDALRRLERILTMADSAHEQEPVSSESSAEDAPIQTEDKRIDSSRPEDLTTRARTGSR